LAQAVARRGKVSRVRGLAYLDGEDVVVTGARPFVPDLDSLSPAWDLVDWSDYTLFPLEGSRLAIVNSSRGCPHNCAFCSQQKFWERGWRARPPESFVNELEYLADKFGIDVVMLSDEYPTPDRHRWERILDLLIERDLGIHLLLETRVTDIIRDAEIMWKYRKAGVLHVYVGVEATGQERLDVFRKGIECDQSREAIKLLNQAGIVTECSFVLGLPHETPETIAETLELAKLYDPDLPQFLMIAPWPYSDMFDDLKEHIVTRDYSKYNFVEPVVKPRNMTTEELQAAVVNCYRGFYSAKVKDYFDISDTFKRDYLLTALREMMKNSFLAKYINAEEAHGMVSHR
ncbi:MAG: radical SAM protein, partial [Chloroflexi bacterium]|nr:radical SAM protein [Chloroflexota bacterium]